MSMFFASSCGMDEELKPLAGEWQLDSISGGFGGGGFPFEGDVRMIIEGDDLILNVDDATSFTATISHKSGEYSDCLIIDTKFVEESEEFTFAFFEEMGYYISEESLSLNEKCADCYSYQFIRI